MVCWLAEVKSRITADGLESRCTVDLFLCSKQVCLARSGISSRMAIPDFTDCGVLPAGVHECTLPEARETLCYNDRRTAIWKGLIGFFDWAAGLPLPTAYLIDGSYVTDKPVPGDVDVVVDITGCEEPEHQQWFDAWSQNHDYVKQAFEVDFYPFVVGVTNDFSAFFQYIRVEEALRRGIPPYVRKGILRVEL